ncbi:MAG: hypothetical protein PHS44_00630, partial [Candidatus Dojkabacteria bacterium]|nr:hypothetical protein [Candidatus Dojkabacteria bacterium]
WDRTVFAQRYWGGTTCAGQAVYDQLTTLTANAEIYYEDHFSSIKERVEKVNYIVDNAAYEDGMILLLFDDEPTVDDLKSLVPFYDEQPVSWTGITRYGMKGNLAWLLVDYDIDPDVQNTTQRVRTMYKIFSLRSEVKAAGLNLTYFTQER